MEYSKLISVTGLSGLFELIGSKADGAIVRSVEDKSTRFISSRIHNFSHLEGIEVFTVGDNVNLVEVFNAMEASNEKLQSEKDTAAIKKYFENVYPDIDFDRVYASDMKKMIKWFDILKKNNVEIKLKEEEEDDDYKEIKDEAVAKPAAEEAAVEISEEESPKKQEAAAKKKQQ